MATTGSAELEFSPPFLQLSTSDTQNSEDEENLSKNGEPSNRDKKWEVWARKKAKRLGSMRDNNKNDIHTQSQTCYQPAGLATIFLIASLIEYIHEIAMNLWQFDKRKDIADIRGFVNCRVDMPVADSVWHNHRLRFALESIIYMISASIAFKSLLTHSPLGQMLHAAISGYNVIGFIHKTIIAYKKKLRFDEVLVALLNMITVVCLLRSVIALYRFKQELYRKKHKLQNLPSKTNKNLLTKLRINERKKTVTMEDISMPQTTAPWAFSLVLAVYIICYRSDGSDALSFNVADLKYLCTELAYATQYTDEWVDLRVAHPEMSNQETYQEAIIQFIIHIALNVQCFTSIMAIYGILSDNISLISPFVISIVPLIFLQIMDLIFDCIELEYGLHQNRNTHYQIIVNIVAFCFVTKHKSVLIEEHHITHYNRMLSIVYAAIRVPNTEEPEVVNDVERQINAVKKTLSKTAISFHKSEAISETQSDRSTSMKPPQEKKN